VTAATEQPIRNGEREARVDIQNADADERLDFEKADVSRIRQRVRKF
jgi:hypothetical protein